MLERVAVIVLLYSSMDKIYLDWAATTPMDSEVASEMVDIYLHTSANPSSTHTPGRKAHKVLEETRKSCASLLMVDPKQLIFTSGGTESNSLPLVSLIRHKSRGEILISKIEHSAVYELSGLFRELGYQVKEIVPDENGIIQPSAVRAQLSRETLAVAVMLVNNEIGSIQPLAEISREIRSFEKEQNIRIHLHCDAVQALGKLPIEPQQLGVDSMAFSGHKFMAPKGVGMLYTRQPFTPLVGGGGQEFGMRPGTENVPAIWAFGTVLKKRYEHMHTEYAHASLLRDKLFEQLRTTDGAVPFPLQRTARPNNEFSPYIIALSVAPVPGEICARVLNDRGFAVGTGSACSSNRKKKRGRVIYAMTSDEETAGGIIRVSFGPTTSGQEIEMFTETLQQELRLLRKTVRRA